MPSRKSFKTQEVAIVRPVLIAWPGKDLLRERDEESKVSWEMFEAARQWGGSVRSVVHPADRATEGYKAPVLSNIATRAEVAARS